MTVMELINDPNPSDNIKCSRCSSLLPPQAKFCSTCGERIEEKKNEVVRTRHGTGDNGVQDHEISDDKLRISSVPRTHMQDVEARPSFPRLHLKSIQSRPPLKMNRITEQTYQSSLLPPAVRSPIVAELPTQSLPIPDIDTKKHDSMPIVQHIRTEGYSTTFRISANT